MEETQGSADSQENSVQTEQTKQDVVKYESYRKAVGEAKRAKQQRDDLASKLEEYEQEKLSASGQKDEVISSLRKQLSEKESLLQEKDSNYTWNVLSSQVKTAALKENCLNPDKLLRLLEKDDLAAMEVNDDYQINADDLKRLVDKAKDDNPFLFKKTVSDVKDVTPSGKVENKTTKLNELSLDQKLKLFGELSSN